MIVGTAGHIDHGKTSLVRALTGIDTDRLPEERARGITLDLGFAYVPLPGGGVLGFVDVPGHERLVHTMIAGASSIGMALLVVAADDGVMPQTREHLQILSLLGLDRGVVALTKTDLVDADRAVEVQLDIEALLEETPLAGAEVFPVSPVTGAGIAALRTRLLADAAREAARRDVEHDVFRLAVDRSFSLAGAGTIVTGSVLAGAVRAGDAVLLLCGGQGGGHGDALRARVRGIHSANRAVERAIAGDRCALNLAGPGIGKEAIGRGDWVVDPAAGATTRRADARLHLLPTERAALRHWTPVLLHHGAGQAAARVVLLAPETLRPGEDGLAQLVLDRPLPLRHGDRLVLRDTSASRTIAGGRVLDPRAPERHRRRPARLAALRALTAGDRATALRGLLAEPPFLVPRAVLLADWGLAASGLAALVPEAIAAADHLALPGPLAALARDAAAALGAFHAAQPAAGGMTAEALRLALPTRLPKPAFAALLAYLVQAGVAATEAHLLRDPAHRGGLAGEEARLWDAIRPLLAEAPHRPPLLREMATAIAAPEVALRRACKGYARAGLVLEVAPDRFFLREAVLEMAGIAHALSAELPEGFSAAQFRDRTGSGRQLAIAVLDYLDRRGVTVRRGDLRRAGRDPAAVFGGAVPGG
ncbi:MAG: selenocysteine-specific translation elongation factor [Acetobacteraceae bacterium]|nr:selenocysteine-specific translation elongation factor [Acetobacteraceae bacterium]